MKNIMKLLLIVTLLTSLHSAEKKDDKVDYFTLTALMIKDGFYKRARVTIEAMDTKAKKFDFARYYLLYGLLELKTKNYQLSIDYLEKSLEFGQENPVVYVYMIQSYYAQKDYANTIITIDRGGEYTNKPNFIALKSDCYWRLEDQNSALEVLSKGMSDYPEYEGFHKQKFGYLASMKLYKVALKSAKKYLEVKSKISEMDYLMFGNSFRLAKELDSAIVLLEEAKIKYPKSDKVAIVLANSYMDKGELFAAAELFYQASFYNQALSKETAELYKQTKELFLALNSNQKILNQSEKLKQRLSILLELAAYEEAASMEYALSREELLKNEDIRYALAYSHYMAHNFDKAEFHLKKLTRSDLFVKASELRKSMQRCREDVFECE
jgi:lipopolysaccharide biosynthesis regulator YciM